MCARLVKFPSPKVSTSRTGIAHACMDQMILLKKMDRKRLKENPTDDNYFCTHQCKHWNALISFLWKVNGKILSRPTDGPGDYHAVHAERHLEKNFNERGSSSIENVQMIKKRKETHEEEVIT